MEQKITNTENDLVVFGASVTKKEERRLRHVMGKFGLRRSAAIRLIINDWWDKSEFGNGNGNERESR